MDQRRVIEAVLADEMMRGLASDAGCSPDWLAGEVARVAGNVSGSDDTSNMSSNSAPPSVRCTCAWHMGMRDPEAGCLVDHARRTPLFQYTGQIDGKALRVDVTWDGSRPQMKWTSHDPA